MADQFPRTKDIPSQSPLYWVEQKDRYLRQLAIRDIEEITGRRLIVYFANRFAKGSDIDRRDPTYVTEILRDIGNWPTDILLETNGGLTDATESLISLIQSSVSDFRVLVPNAAKSNGTLLALAASSIVMGATSELGPIDPHIQGTPCNILKHPQVAATNFPLNQLALNFIQQTKTLATKLLSAGMLKGKTPAEIQTVVEKLADGGTYFSHGCVIDHVEASQLGLNIQYLPPTDELWKRLWLLYCMYDFDSRKSGYLKIFEGGSVSTAVAVSPAASP